MSSDKFAAAQSETTRVEDDADARLPRYSRASDSSQAVELIEHQYKLEDSKGRPWVWMNVKSRAKDKRSWPLVYERDTISGTVEVDFAKTDGVKGVSIAISAGVTAVGQEEMTFLTQSQELWDAKTSGKPPKGPLSWPFALTMPNEVLTADKPKGKAEPYSLPPTFSERASPAYIDYKLIVTVRKGAFKVNQTLTTSIFYTPLTRAEPPFPLREAAYIDGTAIIGPDGDPQGWKVLPPVQIKGTLFNTRPVEIECTVAIAEPLSFAIGSPVPLFMTFTANDDQALDVVCSPTAIKMGLMRERALGSHATKSGSGLGNSSSVLREIMSSAYFWPALEGAQEPLTRKLQGELDLRKTLRPSFAFPGFALRYDVCFYPSQAPGFVPANPEGALLTERISVHTLNATGIVPRSYAPPGYAQSTEGNYNNVAGYLENGNQRFYHHGGFQ